MSEIRTFFIQLGKETKKVAADGDDLKCLPDIVRSKFGASPSVTAADNDALSFEMKDKEFGVVAKVDNFQDIYAGAVVTCKVKGASSGPSKALVQQVETAKRKLESLQSHVGQKRARSNGDSAERWIVRMRGLPWHSSQDDIRNFFGTDVSIVPEGIVLVQKLGRPSGEAFVELMSDEDFQKALSKDHNNMGARYIEVYRATANEAERGGLGTRSGSVRQIPVSSTSRVLRLRGLPYSATEVDVHAFLEGVTPVAVHFPLDHLGRPSGDCFVEVADDNDESLVLARSKHNMGERYIDVMKSDSTQLRNVMHVPDPASSSTATSLHGFQIITPDVQRCIRMRGLPWGTEERDINLFFQAVDLIPTCIHRKADGSEAYCEFANVQEAAKAMTRNKCFIGARYIELFYVAYNEMASQIGLPLENPNPYGGGGGGGFGGGYPMQPSGGGGYGDMSGGYAGGSGGYGGMGGGGQRGGQMMGGGNSYGASRGGYGGGGGGYAGGDQYGAGNMYGGGGGASGGGSTVKMRGLPFSATKNDIVDFFRGHPIIASTISIGQDASGRPDGQAFVSFPNLQSARTAVAQNDRQYMQNRYIELSLHNA